MILKFLIILLSRKEAYNEISIKIKRYSKITTR